MAYGQNVPSNFYSWKALYFDFFFEMLISIDTHKLIKPCASDTLTIKHFLKKFYAF